MPMDEKEFRYKVEAMRNAQDAYFALRRDPKTTPNALHNALVEAKQLEREIDSAIKEFNAVEHGESNPSQEKQMAMEFDP